MKWNQGQFLISDDPRKLDFDRICQLLQTTYWAQKRSPDVITRSIQNSIPLGLYYAEQQIGFPRIVTDHSTFAWICDVIVDPAYRGRSLGKWLVETAIAHPAAQVSLQLLRTRDAHMLYEQVGFTRQECLTRRPDPAEAWESIPI